MSETDPKAEDAGAGDAKPAAALRKAGAKARDGIEQGIRQAGRKGRTVIVATKEKGEAVLSATLEKGEAVIDATREKGEAVFTATREKGEAVIAATREKGEAVIDDTREKTMRAAAETNRLFQEHPITAVAAAAAAGAIVGIFLPRLHMTARAGALAGRAVKAAVASEATQRIVSGIIDAGKGATRGKTKKS